jgi:hypothetical protein
MGPLPVSHLGNERARRTGRGAYQNAADALTQLRERGAVPWGWLVDET